LTDTTLRAAMPNPEKIMCVGLNYERHRVETKRLKAGHPTIFARYAYSQIGHEAQILNPKVS
jgi:2-keto-4-pentenoate hydratase/2-oxohepta-3-ene-1,7-dioic acid hydratase in catechol pathway